MDFSAENLQARRKWDDIFKVLKEKTINQEYHTQQNYHLKTKEMIIFPRQTKPEGVSHHLTCLIRNT